MIIMEWPYEYVAVAAVDLQGNHKTEMQHLLGKYIKPLLKLNQIVTPKTFNFIDQSSAHHHQHFIANEQNTISMFWT